MPVVINEFELVDEPEPAASASPEAQAMAPPGAELDHLVEQVLRRRRDRARRLQAD